MSDRVKKCTTPNTIPICVYKSVFSSIQTVSTKKLWCGKREVK